MGEYLRNQNPRAAAAFGDAIAEIMTRLSYFPDSGHRLRRDAARYAQGFSPIKSSIAELPETRFES
jgi:plasmid stabilization system protein ParE